MYVPYGKTRPKPQYHQRQNNNRDHGGGATIRQNCYSKSNLQGRIPIIRRGLLRIIYRLLGSHVQNLHRLMSGYAARTYDNRDNIKMILNKLKTTTLENPEVLDSMADGVDRDIHREYVNAYAKENRYLTRGAK